MMMPDASTWSFRAQTSTYLRGWTSWAVRESRSNDSYCERRFRMGWQHGPTPTCPRCDEKPAANVCPPPGTLSDFVRSFGHAFVLCHSHTCARHLSGYWPVDLDLEIFDAAVFNRRLARKFGPAVAHALGLTRPGRRALKSRFAAGAGATAHRVLVLLAHLEIVRLIGCITQCLHSAWAMATNLLH